MSIPQTIPNTSKTNYMQGTRRIDEIAMNARQLAYQENYSFTEGWDDNTLWTIINLGLNKLYDKITQVDEPPNIQEFATTVYAGVQEYPIPQDVKLQSQIMNVRYLYGPETWQFVTLEQGMIQDRYSYPTNIPSTYCIRNGNILLSPTPNITRENALIVNFQKRLRKLDYRRGKVTNIISPWQPITNIQSANNPLVFTSNTSGLVNGQKVGIGGIFEPSELIDQTFFIDNIVANTSFQILGIDTTLLAPFTPSPAAIWYSSPIQFALNFNITSQKDVNLQANANSILDKIDWICFVDRNGQMIIDAIPIDSYDLTTFIITCEPNYVVPYASWLLFEAIIENDDTFYCVTGDYSSTHSELDRQCEDLLIEFVVLRLLRLQSAAEPTEKQIQAEEAVIERLSYAYRRYRPSIVSIIWQQRLRRNSYNWGSRGPY